MPDSLSFPELGTILVWIVGATVFVIQKAKAFVCRHFKGGWTQRVPWWLWLVASIAIPFGLVVLVCQQWAQDLINPMLPESLRLTLTQDAVVPTALTAVLGANGAYAVSKKLGLTADYSAGGPLDVTPKPESPIVPAPGEPATEDSSVSATAPEASPGPATPLGVVVPPECMEQPEPEPVLLLSRTIVDPEYVWVDGQLRAVKESESEYVAGPSERSPNHVFVPRDWLKS